jgi:hypothetical protein
MNILGGLDGGEWPSQEVDDGINYRTFASVHSDRYEKHADGRTVDLLSMDTVNTYTANQGSQIGQIASQTRETLIDGFGGRRE